MAATQVRDWKAPLRWIKHKLFSAVGNSQPAPPSSHPAPHSALTLEAALARCQQRQTQIQTVIDVGASDGRWSLIAQSYFPNADFFLLEARQEHEPALQEVVRQHERFSYLISAAGDRLGSIYFDASDLFGGLASHQPFDYDCPTISVPLTTIDHQVRSQNLRPPFLLKLDTHGFEVPIFEGARETLQQTQLICVETYNFQLTPHSLRFHEMCQYLEAQGFRCVDLCEPLHRDLDGAFWQIDFLFAPATAAMFQSNQYG